MPHTIGVCSWSLEPANPAELFERASLTGCRAMQLHLDPLRTGAWDAEEVRERAHAKGISIRSGMMTMIGEDYATLETIARTGGVRPDATWNANRDAARGNAAVARSLGLDLVTFHAGHLPESLNDPLRATMIERLREIVEVFEEQSVRVGLETGQESAGTLAGYLDEIPGAGVNFDPANMILYAMGDPHAALEALAARVVQIHIKDAVPTQTAGAWGTEVPVGAGGVDWRRFLEIVSARTPGVDLMIEREAGDARVADITSAHSLVHELIGAEA